MAKNHFWSGSIRLNMFISLVEILINSRSWIMQERVSMRFVQNKTTGQFLFCVCLSFLFLPIFCSLERQLMSMSCPWAREWLVQTGSVGILFIMVTHLQVFLHVLMSTDIWPFLELAVTLEWRCVRRYRLAVSTINVSRYVTFWPQQALPFSVMCDGPILVNIDICTNEWRAI